MERRTLPCGSAVAIRDMPFGSPGVGRPDSRLAGTPRRTAVAAAEAESLDYQRLPAGLQPHWQFDARQPQPSLGHAQEQLAQSQIPQLQMPQQVPCRAVFSAVFFCLVIVFSLLLISASCAFKGADVLPAETLQCSLGEVWADSR